MPSRTRRAAPARTKKAADRAREHDVHSVLAWLERTGTKANRDGMARYAIPSDNAFGVSVGALQQ